MIKSAHIVNRQSHEDTILEFVPGVNIIRGISNAGKTAIFRSLEATIRNIYWTPNNIRRGQKSGRVTIEVETDDEVTRERIKGENRYIINGKPLKPLRTGIPSEIQRILRMDDVNFAGQHDGPFLLFDSPGKVSGFINEIVGMDEIDRTQSNLNSGIRTLGLNIGQLSADVEMTEQELKGFEGLDELVGLLEGAETAETKWKGVSAQALQLDDLLQEKSERKGQRSSALQIVKLAPRVKGVESAKDDVLVIGNEVTGLENLISRRKTNQKIKENNENILSLQDQYDETIKAMGVWAQASVDLKKMQYNIAERTGFREECKLLRLEIEELKEELPDVCPTCGQEVKEWVI